MNIKVETLPNYRIAYVRQVGPYGPSNVHLMQEIKEWAAAKSLLSKTAIILGITHDNPETTPPENCRYDAGIVIRDDFQIDSFVCESKLFGGKYAIFKVKHTADDIKKAWNKVYVELTNDGYQIDARPIFERYIGEMVCNNYCEICIPLK